MGLALTTVPVGHRPVMSGTSTPRFGQAVKRVEDGRFLTGRGRYTDDVDLPGQCHAVFVRSPHAHARILSLDSTEAEAMPGVVAVLTGADYAAAGLGLLVCGWMIHSIDGSPMKVGEHPPLARDRVRYVGDHVAVVIATDRNTAKTAAELVYVDYEDLPANVDASRARTEGTPRLHDVSPDNCAFDWALGDEAATNAAFERASHVTRLTLVNNRLVPNALEPRAVNASYDAAREHFTVYLASQNPHGIRQMLSAVIGLAPEHRLRVISEDVGGGFGSKAFNYAEEVVCTWASRVTGRPVKWTAERNEAFLSDAHGRDHHSVAELALDEEHRFLGLRVQTTANMGAYLSTFGSLIPTYVYATLLSGQYVLPAIYARVAAVYTNTAPVDAYRGAGRPEASYVLERLVDLAARQLGVDPAELRRRNFITQFPYQTPVELEYDIGGFDATLQKALELADYAGFPARREAALREGKLRGIGLAAYIEAAGIGPSRMLGKLGAGSGLWESAEVRVNPTGSVEVLTGCHAHGQGHETTYAQLVADKFGIDLDAIQVLHGDTDKVQFGMGTYGSRSGPVGMASVALACDKVIAKAQRVAAYMLDVPAASVAFEAGAFTSPQTNRALAFHEVALGAYAAHDFPTSELEPGLKEGCFFDPPNFTYPAGTYVCELEVDRDTGVVTLIDFIAVDDFGTVVNPMIVEGQVHGGLAQGIGQALLERTVYEPESGQLLSATFMDYCLPRADDLPDFRVAMTSTPSPSNPLGIKGCGEAGAIGAPPALVNALCNALDVDHIDMPATSESLWRLLQS